MCICDDRRRFKTYSLQEGSETERNSIERFLPIGFLVQAVRFLELIESVFFESCLDPMQNIEYVVLFRPEK